MSRDWRAWHEAYDDPSSPLSLRLAEVRSRITEWLDERWDEPARAVSLCAGQGHDLLPVLAAHPSGRSVRAVLVENDPHNAAVAERTARDHGLDVEVRCADAGTTDAYAGAVPADLVLVCGVFGNVTDWDVQRTVEALPAFCAPGATVVWTRSRRAPDLTPSVLEWLEGAGFEEVSFDAPDGVLFTVGVHRYTGEPREMTAGQHLFRFVG